MAVIKSKRSENPLQVLDMARGLVLYTLTICNNEKLFPKRDRWLLTGEIVRTALRIYTSIRHANRIKVEDTADYARRMELQNLALEDITNLMGLIDIAASKCRLPGSRQHYWTGLCVELENKTRSWHRSDKARLHPGAMTLEAGGHAAEPDAMERIMKQIGTALAKQSAGVVIASGSGAV